MRNENDEWRSIILYNESQKVGQEETRGTYQQDIINNDRMITIEERRLKEEVIKQERRKIYWKRIEKKTEEGPCKKDKRRSKRKTTSMTEII